MTQSHFSGFGTSLEEKTERAINLLHDHESAALELSQYGYFLAFSGGKDSIVIHELARLAGVAFKAYYSQTTIDPPEIVRFIRSHYPIVEWRRAKRNFFRSMIDVHGPPSRLIRWCCEEFKEGGGDGLYKILGVRRAESMNRKKNWLEINKWRCEKGGLTICPIAFWSDMDVWQFIHRHNLSYCSLYDEGWQRLGCIGCPMAGKNRHKEFLRWPGFKKAWQWAFREYFNARKGKPRRDGTRRYIDRFTTWQEYYNWWMSENPSSIEQDECLGLWDA
jgi:phosphoadenosine phosphosulfate reductase